MAPSKGTLDKTYDPAPIEGKWYQAWNKRGLFKGIANSEKPHFSVVIPPPNVTGSLHMGHALNNTLQDISCRFMRMTGFNVLWLPGTDHAGIATQNVVERSLASEGVSRHELGREKFIEKVWEWKKEYGDRIINQLKRLGASCDWERERFTMDEGLSRAVRAVFVRLYKENLIYKGSYIVNWCPRCLTALSDLEVEHRDERGTLFYVRYPFVDGSGYVTVATTRPETILGDVAVAVHPRDERHWGIAGKEAVVPVTDRIVPIIEDTMVDPGFGTGLVKITPAHDPNDFLVGQRHGLETIQVIDEKGFMSPEAGPLFEGLDSVEARKKMVSLLKEKGLLERTEEHDHAIGHCYRCGTVIEPYLSEQWFVKMAPLAAPGIEAVRDCRIRIIPEQLVGTYNNWMENIRDWCISRQLWWGHRIPAWYCYDCGHVTVSEVDPDRCECCGGGNIHQDEDVLDTWFSSALWPFSTLGWPDDTEDLRTFYPTSLLVTGFDILFFWVARMIMMGLKFMGKEPFSETYIHALVRDEQGQKMSKSKGNVIDPLEIIDKYGADSLRMTLASLTVQGRDIFLSPERIESNRLFMNKIWNASKLALANIEGVVPGSLPDERHLRIHDRWIIRRVNEVNAQVRSDLEGYFYGEAAKALYQFVWSELCDWYLEMAKPALRGLEGDRRQETTRTVMALVFDSTIRMLHPFIPFLTEELWDTFGFGEGALIEEKGWPGILSLREALAPGIPDPMEVFQELVRSIRNLRAEAGLHPRQEALEARVVLSDGAAGEAGEVIGSNADLLRLLCRVREVSLSEDQGRRTLGTMMSVASFGEVSLFVNQNLDRGAEMARLSAELERARKDLSRSMGKLGDPSFLSRAPGDIVEQERQRLSETEDKIRVIERNMRNLSE